MSKKLAPDRLNTDNLQFERKRGDDVKVFSAGGRPLCTIHRHDWKKVAKFFKEISADGALL